MQRNSLEVLAMASQEPTDKTSKAEDKLTGENIGVRVTTLICFKDLEEDKVPHMVASLPLAGYFSHVDYLLFEKMY